MQLPPTILSLDDKKKKKVKQAPPPTAKSSVLNSKKKKDPVVSVETPKDLPESGSDSSEDSDSENTLSKVVTNLLLNQTSHKIKLVPPRTLETKLFDRLEAMYGASIEQMLEVQCRFVAHIVPTLLILMDIYSMHQQICTFPSKTLYASKLKSHESVASHLLHDLPNTQAESEEDEKEYLQTPVVYGLTKW
jgi:DNA polymerase alpha-associated DNA helicase A